MTRESPRSCERMFGHKGCTECPASNGVDNEDKSSTCHRNGPEHHHIFGRVHLTFGDESNIEESNAEYHYFSIEGVLSYVGFFDDFGPMSLGTIHRFCEILDLELNRGPQTCQVALRSSRRREDLTNALFLLGAYMAIKLSFKISDIMQTFEPFRAETLPYRDVSPGKQTFNLALEDCLGGLLKAKQQGWVRFEPDGFNPHEYAHFDDPLNADLHEIIPGKFVAMKGPEDLPGGRSWSDVHNPDGTFSHRAFSAEHYAYVLGQFNVRAVMRLNEPLYSTKAFNDVGIAVADLYFDDCSAPPPEIVAKFLAMADALPGAIAVHCRAGLGRTGTLIALYLMKHYGFSAREAIGWIRIVRPGSVIGTQQAFLCGKEALMHRHRPGRSPPSNLKAPLAGPCLPSDASLQEVERVIARTIRRVDAQSQALRAALVVDGGSRPTAAASPVEGALLANPVEGALAAHVAAVAVRRSGVRVVSERMARMREIDPGCAGP